MQMLQTAATRCYKALRHPPEASCCLFCERNFAGEGTWDDRMEHVGRHLELMRRANEQPPESKDWRHDDPMEKWMASYRIIVPNGDGWILDDQQLTQKPPRRTSSISQLPRQMVSVNPAPPPLQPQPQLAPAAPIKVAPAPPKMEPPQIDPVPRQATPPPPPPAPAAARVLPAPNGRLSSPDRLFSAFDEPSEQPVKTEQAEPNSSTDTSPVTNTDTHLHTNGAYETETTKVAARAPLKTSTRGRGKRSAAKQRQQAEAGAEDEEDPYLSLFQTIPKRKKDRAAGDDDDEDEEDDEAEFEDSRTIAGGSERYSRKRQVSPARSTNSFCGSLKDRIYSGFQKAVMGMATSVTRLFVEPTDGQPGSGQRATPVAKRTRTARAQEKAIANGLEDDDEHDEPVEPKRKRQRRGRKERDGSAVVRESSTSSLSMNTRSSGRVKDSTIEKGVISSRS